MPIAVKISLGVEEKGDEEKKLIFSSIAIILWEFEKKKYGQFIMKGCKDEE